MHIVILTLTVDLHVHVHVSECIYIVLRNSSQLGRNFIFIFEYERKIKQSSNYDIFFSLKTSV